MKTGVEVDRGSKGSQALELDEDRGSIIKGPDEEKERGTSKQEVSYMCNLTYQHDPGSFKALGETEPKSSSTTKWNSGLLTQSTTKPVY